MNPIHPFDEATDRLPATARIVRCRTVELAILAGRSPMEIQHRDYEQAKRELTGETNSDRQLEIIYRK